ncbi:MAG: CDP-glycerol glycerophosphotransferase family protein [Lachnospiraceae bacterium]|nr:CDP-glycerol glycerophosphotransferase family protein [Lachnospiraceae bacterium]
MYIFIRKIYWKIKRKIRGVISKGYRFYTLRILYPKIYKKGLKKQLDNSKVVFVEVRSPEISDSFRLIYDDLKANYNFNVTEHFLETSFVSRVENIKRTKAMIEDISDAKYVFLNESTNVLSFLSMRKETIVTQLWHACGAFKKFGMSTADLIFGDDRRTLEKYPYHKNYTYATVSSSEIVWAYEEAMGYEDKKGVVVPVGVSRTDYFYKDDVRDKAFNKLYKLFPEAKDKKVILYAPTFRGRVASANTPDLLDVEMFRENFESQYVLIFKHHPFVKERPEIPKGCEGFARDFTDDMAIEELLIVSDICISDYSSLIFEYSLFERPMIFFAYDLDEYYDWRGFFYDFKEFVPGPIYYDNESMVKYISDVENNFDRQQVIAFKEKFMSACDGHSTERIMKLVFEDKLETYRR